MSRSHDASIHHLLVVRTDRIGDVLLSTPVLSGLREQFPDSRIAMLVSPYAREVVDGHPALDDVFVDDQAGKHRGFLGWLRLVGDIRAQRFDALVVLHPTLRLALLGVIAGIPVRVGSGYRAYGVLFNRRVYEHRKDARRHEVEYNMRIAAALGVQATPSPPIIVIPDAARQAIASRLDAWGVETTDTLVALHPGSGGSARSWPAASFAALGDRLAMECGARVVLTGGPSERALVESVIGQMRTRPLTIVGETTIKELAALLAVCQLCVTNSTGPLHLAAAVGTPTVALFCPITPCSPVRWGPYGDGHRVLKPDVPACPRCIGLACEYFDCMTRISVDVVYKATQEILTGSSA